MNAKRILIVGGVAGGMSAAARARRLSENAEIIVFERGPYPSFANCGLPYYLGGEIPDRDDLLVQTPQNLRARFNLDVRILNEVVAIDRAAKQVRIRRLQTGEEYTEAYDALVLAPGATPLKPPIPGIDRPGHFVVRTIPDVEAMDAWIRSRHPKRALIVGGGFIGLEMAEQLTRRGLHVSLAEALPQVMNALDVEIAAHIHAELTANGVHLYLGDPVMRFEDGDGASVAVLKSGRTIPADIVVLGMGVKPEVTLARDAGLEIGALGGIRVNERLQTSDPAIWAVGDAIEVRHAITGEWSLVPLAGPANRQGRLAADAIMGRPVRFEGVLGTGIVRTFGITAAGVGASEKQLQHAGMPYEAVHIHSISHAGYYPGAKPMTLKLLFDPRDGRVLGAQIAGRDGVDKRIDVLAAAIHGRMTVQDLEDLELAYSPPFSSARDPVNLAGMVANNALKGDVSLVQWRDIEHTDPERTLLLDVRQPEEYRAGHIPGAVNIPLPELRQRLGELPKNKEILVYCAIGQRSYYACRILSAHGIHARNLTGAYRTWQAGRKGRDGEVFKP
ncbi:MAG: FAD-dependent oxidoreductase [Chthonomonadales bacterium]